MKNLLFTLVLICVTLFSFGQDKIIKRDRTEILCKVTEIGTTEIKYKKADNLEGPTYTVNKSEVLKIIFENGTEENFEVNEMSVVPSKNRHLKRAITTRPFSLLAGHVCLGYQQALHPTRAFIAEIGWIGPSVGDLFGPASGAYGRIGFRLKSTPEVVSEGMEWGFNLGGYYIQPEIAYSSFSKTTSDFDWRNNITVTSTRNYTSGAFLISFGRQMIAGDIMTFDMSSSIGYGFTSAGVGNPNFFHYSHAIFSQGTPIALNVTISMGFLVK